MHAAWQATRGLHAAMGTHPVMGTHAVMGSGRGIDFRTGGLMNRDGTGDRSRKAGVPLAG